MKNYSMVAINPELHAKVKTFCSKRGMTIGGLVSMLLVEYMTRHEAREKQMREKQMTGSQ